MLTSCRELHVVDPHFGPENARHRKVLEALMDVLGQSLIALQLIRLHCSDKSKLAFFEDQARQMAARLPAGIAIEFVRWREKPGGEKLHNRYVLTDVGGVSFGAGLDAGAAGQTDDVSILGRTQYLRRWDQYAQEKAFECADRPAKVVGTRTGH